MRKSENIYLPDGTEIASYIGSPELADVVAAVILRFDEEGVIAHGVKRAVAVGSVALQGVLNNCPDNGKMESFWTTGRRIFLSEGTPYHYMRTFDTTFFNYSRGAVALTTLDQLEEHGITPPARRRHTTLTLDQPVPPTAIELLVSPPVESDEGSVNQDPRATRQAFERTLLCELARIAEEGITPGCIRQIR